VGTVRPYVVWFGEMPRFMEEIQTALSHADLFVSIGTSGQVYPAAGFGRLARMARAHTVEVNLEPTVITNDFAQKVRGPASETLPKLVEEWLKG
jgi:NAD-dependent deacetylase